MEPENPMFEGVVEDFLAIDVKTHRYECILTHVDNLLKKVKAVRPNVDPMVRAGVIPRLVDLLNHNDRRHLARLQHTAVVTLKYIIESDEDTDYCDKFMDEDGVLALLKLLKLRLDGLTTDVLSLAYVLGEKQGTEPFSTQLESVEVLFETITSTWPPVKYSALKALADLFSEKALNQGLDASMMTPYFPRLIQLLSDSDVRTATLTSHIVRVIASDASSELAEALMTSGFLPLLTSLLRKGLEDKRYAESTQHVISCIRHLASNGVKHVQMLLQSEILEILPPYMEKLDREQDTYKNLQWTLAYIIALSDMDVAACMVKSGLVPSLRWIVTTGGYLQMEIATQLLKHLLQIKAFLVHFIDECVLDYLVYVNVAGNHLLLMDLLQVFNDALCTIKSPEKQADLQGAMCSADRLDKFTSLQSCPNGQASALAAKILNTCLG